MELQGAAAAHDLAALCDLWRAAVAGVVAGKPFSGGGPGGIGGTAC